MQISFSELRAKEVINIADGSKLGRVCDLTFSYPDNKVLGLLVPEGKGFCSKKMFIEMKRIVKIGGDVILVDVGEPKGSEKGDKENKDDKGKCGKRPSNCPSYCPPHCLPSNQGTDRRSFEEYE